MILSTFGILLAGISLARANTVSSHHRRHAARSASSNGAAAVPDATSDLVAASWYAGWQAQDVPLNNVSWDRFTHMTYSFAYVQFFLLVNAAG